ncbi:TPA: hypothetical protein EYP44_04295 [Candidatus Bathyarchaeota archaeon]|nr:hypothetical protein [Candidatus Bathyarchaeota archaeon]
MATLAIAGLYLLITWPRIALTMEDFAITSCRNGSRVHLRLVNTGNRPLTMRKVLIAADEGCRLTLTFSYLGTA